MYFSIAAPQDIVLPNGPRLSFRVNPADTSLVEIHISDTTHNDVLGTHVLTFKRNGGPNDTSFVPTQPVTNQPPYKSVNDDAVRAQDPDWRRRQEVEREGLGQPMAGDTFAPAGKAAAAPVDTKPAA